MNLQPSLSVEYNDRRVLFPEELKFGGHGQRYLNGGGTYTPSTSEYVFYKIDFLTDSVVSSVVFRNKNDAGDNLYDGSIVTNTPVPKGTVWNSPLAAITLASGTAIAYQYKKFIPEDILYPSAIDADVLTWYNNVITAGGAGEWGSTDAARVVNKIALNNLVVSLKANNLWAGYYYRVLAGPNTLAGGLASGIGGTVTNVNFLAGNVNPLTGWLGDTSSKYLNTDWAGNRTGQNDFSVFCWVSTAATGSCFGNDSAGVNLGITAMLQFNGFITARAKSSGYDISTYGANTAGLIGISRSSSTTATIFAGTTRQDFTRSSDGNLATRLTYFARDGANFYGGRMAMIGQGPAINTTQQTSLNSIFSTYLSSIVL
jgi:hypothetical protein